MKKDSYDTIDSKLLQSFQIIKKLGQGAYGQVWKAKNKKQGRIVALKKVGNAFVESSTAQKAYRQIKYLQRLNHPNIVKVIGFYPSSHPQELYIQMEFMEADLCLALTNSLLKPIHKQYIFYQLTNAITYLHSAQLIHRDIKPTNILVNEACDTKICDFGLVRSIHKQSPQDNVVMTENIGTRWYRAPQILLGSKFYSKPSDIWSLGCVLAQMMMQRPLFQGTSTFSQLEKIFELTGIPSQTDLQFLQNQSAIKLATSIRIKEKKTIKNILKTDDEQLIDILEKMLQVNPLKRLTAQRILNHPYLSKFRGRIQEKNSLQPIKILYESRLLEPDDYKSLLYSQLQEKKHKDSIESSSSETGTVIYKTMPESTRKSFFKTIKSHSKSPLHTSNLQQNFELQRKSFKPRATPLHQIAEVSTIRRSPSFLQKKTKSPANKSFTPKQKTMTPPKNFKQLQNLPGLQGQFKPKVNFPIKLSPKNNSETNIQEKHFFLKKQSSNPEHHLKLKKKLSQGDQIRLSQKIAKFSPVKDTKSINFSTSIGQNFKIPKQKLANINTIGDIFSKPRQFPKLTIPLKNQTPTKTRPIEIGKSPQNQTLKKSPSHKEPGVKGLTFKQRTSPGQKMVIPTTPPSKPFQIDQNGF